ncbi:hypothetical protein NLJ89_g11260 [Agrocybe chaxingu]|uniref:Uncharacterized protein n=1 Tax=Agrocybe chaxingu TaxID=84603 RepID=A0A9W8JX43_9AGAR|nr:hypothetical protein NLJ89_g11260 [Agrocybe chaxingu]
MLYPAKQAARRVLGDGAAGLIGAHGGVAMSNGSREEEEGQARWEFDNQAKGPEDEEGAGLWVEAAKGRD